MLTRFRDWLFARIRASGNRAASGARQAEWLRAPPSGRNFVSELERVLRETGADSARGHDASGGNSSDEHGDSAAGRPATLTEHAGLCRSFPSARRTLPLTDRKTPRR